ncbi:MAG: hypothetical protein H7334_12315 [Ferruginibacter sp.]|nr:hypothetical protein [Ferruginibacter sp.]
MPEKLKHKSVVACPAAIRQATAVLHSYYIGWRNKKNTIDNLIPQG